ncbi:uncharacterized protein [Cherax quadricarinatus]|uniref:uncharacterized protein n=1 Tax=Cherax quadricarinatus TaxID=27406 RepID=UPI00387E4B7B
MNRGDVSVPPEGVVEESAAAVVVAEAAQAEGQELQNPWPHLDDYFVLKSRDTKNANILHFLCVMCQPKETIIKGQAVSLYNLKSHVRRKHPAHAIKFEERIKAGSSRGKHGQSSCGSATNRSSSQSSQPPAKRARQTTIGEAFVAAGTSVCQSVVDTKIVDLFVCNMLPLHVVESPTFVSLIKTLNPSKASMSRHTLGRRILVSHKQLEEHLIRYL